MVWLTATRTAKLLPHLWQRPQDIIYVPAFIAFGYYFAVMKVYALLTLHEVRPRWRFITSSLANHLERFRLAGEHELVSGGPVMPWQLWMPETKPMQEGQAEVPQSRSLPTMVLILLLGTRMMGVDTIPRRPSTGNNRVGSLDERVDF